MAQLRHVLFMMLLGAVSTDIASGSSSWKRSVDKRSPAMHFCGPSLADALEMVCEYGMGKRSTTAPRHSLLRPEFSGGHLSISSASTMPYYQTQLYHSADSSRTKRSPGIVEECCLNPCTLNTLAQYC
ncbi:Bombyxin B-2 [Amphibalanus amphitrite]|uniref:Bombyxin B-2 n=1 Tax=Amphibalanus amphitrite TaxID=1232801 RepID=A0A6A4X224_AMPAM|nr:Bombyxin B-2 [Amphibalanus amphitrite]